MSVLKTILIAQDNASREKGLMFHNPPLKEDECALFKFDRPGKHSFWNKNVQFPISLLFCSADGKIEDIKYLKANQIDPVVSSSSNITYVVEAHENIPKKLKLKNGSKIEILK
jgi:uncharacterized membrane protein (UPF0127 family)